MSSQTTHTITLSFNWMDFLNFWLVGGLSLVFFIGVYLVFGTALDLELIRKSAFWAFCAAFVVNNPHFAHSYQLFYENFASHLRDTTTQFITKARFIVAGIIAPAIMVGYFLRAYTDQSTPMLSYAIAAMLFFVGWHYVKQGYGVLITLSVQKKIYYEELTKKVLIINAYVVWIYSWLKVSGVVSSFFGTTYKYPDIPTWLVTSALVIMILTSTMSLLLLIKEWVINKKKVSINGLTGYISASYVWMVFQYINPLFIAFVPLFHSLQYLPFVYQYKMGEIKDKHGDTSQSFYKSPAARLVLFALIGIGLGAAFMYAIPKSLGDNHTDLFNRQFFAISFLVFINIHHYFIDHAFWRRDNKKVQQFLFRRSD